MSYTSALCGIILMSSLSTLTQTERIPSKQSVGTHTFFCRFFSGQHHCSLLHGHLCFLSGSLFAHRQRASYPDPCLAFSREMLEGPDPISRVARYKGWMRLTYQCSLSFHTGQNGRDQKLESLTDDKNCLLFACYLLLSHMDSNMKA